MKTRNKNLFQTLDDILGTRAELVWKLRPIYSMFSEKNDNDELEDNDNPLKKLLKNNNNIKETLEALKYGIGIIKEIVNKKDFDYSNLESYRTGEIKIGGNPILNSILEKIIGDQSVIKAENVISKDLASSLQELFTLTMPIMEKSLKNKELINNLFDIFSEILKQTIKYVNKTKDKEESPFIMKYIINKLSTILGIEEIFADITDPENLANHQISLENFNKFITDNKNQFRKKLTKFISDLKKIDTKDFNQEIENDVFKLEFNTNELRYLQIILSNRIDSSNKTFVLKEDALYIDDEKQTNMFAALYIIGIFVFSNIEKAYRREPEIISADNSEINDSSLESRTPPPSSDVSEDERQISRNDSEDSFVINRDLASAPASVLVPVLASDSVLALAPVPVPVPVPASASASASAQVLAPAANVNETSLISEPQDLQVVQEDSPKITENEVEIKSQIRKLLIENILKFNNEQFTTEIAKIKDQFQDQSILELIDKELEDIILDKNFINFIVSNESLKLFCEKLIKLLDEEEGIKQFKGKYLGVAMKQEEPKQKALPEHEFESPEQEVLESLEQEVLESLEQEVLESAKQEETDKPNIVERGLAEIKIFVTTTKNAIVKDPITEIRLPQSEKKATEIIPDDQRIKKAILKLFLEDSNQENFIKTLQGEIEVLKLGIGNNNGDLDSNTNLELRANTKLLELISLQLKALRFDPNFTSGKDKFTLFEGFVDKIIPILEDNDVIKLNAETKKEFIDNLKNIYSRKTIEKQDSIKKPNFVNDGIELNDELPNRAYRSHRSIWEKVKDFFKAVLNKALIKTVYLGVNREAGKLGSENLEEIAARELYTAHKFQYSYTTQSFRSTVDNNRDKSQNNLSLS